MAGLNPFGTLAHAIKTLGHTASKAGHNMVHMREHTPGYRFRSIQIYKNVQPITTDALFVAPSAVVAGNVILGNNSSLMYTAVARNYNLEYPTRIGDNTTVMERATTIGQVRIGHDCIIGPGATLDCCDVHDNVYIGAQACIQIGCVIEDGAIVAPGTNLLKDTRVNAGTFWAGNPGVCVGAVAPEQAAEVQHLVHDAIESAKSHKSAVDAMYEENRVLDYDWLMRCCEQIEARNKAVTSTYMKTIPPEARKFMQPREPVRRLTQSSHTTYPINRIAPWLPSSLPGQGRASDTKITNA